MSQGWRKEDLEKGDKPPWRITLLAPEPFCFTRLRFSIDSFYDARKLPASLRDLTLIIVLYRYRCSIAMMAVKSYTYALPIEANLPSLLAVLGSGKILSTCPGPSLLNEWTLRHRAQ